MHKLLSLLGILALCVLPASAQVPMTGAGLGSPVVSATYQGPGDVFTTSPWAGYSCTRVFTASQANTLTSMCDLVSSAAPTVVLCTLRASSTGFADLSAYCPGSLTPATVCAAATGGVCRVSKAYDLTGNSRDMVGTSNQPALTFSSSPTGTFPCMSDNGTGTTLLAATVSAQAQPLTMSAVWRRTSGTAQGGVIGSSGAMYLGSGSSASQAQESAGTSTVNNTLTDNTWGANNGLLNGASSILNTNGSESPAVNIGSNGTGTTIRIFRANAAGFVGNACEMWVWAASSTATDRGNLNSNQHSVTSGYGAF